MIYKKIEIKSEADLPKEKGDYYLFHARGEGILRLICYCPKIDNVELMPKAYIDGYDFYLLPISEEDYLREELTKFIEYCAISWGYDFNFSIMETYLKKRKDEK